MRSQWCHSVQPTGIPFGDMYSMMRKKPVTTKKKNKKKAPAQSEQLADAAAPAEDDVDEVEELRSAAQKNKLQSDAFIMDALAALQIANNTALATRGVTETKKQRARQNYNAVKV